MLRFAFAVAAVSLLATPVMAAPCRDAKGRFIRCPHVVAKPVKKCRDVKGHFA